MKYLKHFETLDITEVPTKGDYILYTIKNLGEPPLQHGIIKVDNVDWKRGIIYFTTVGKRVYSEQMDFDAYEENIDILYRGRNLSRAEDIVKKLSIQNRFDL